MCLEGLTVTQDLVNVLGPARDSFCQMYCHLYVCVLLRLVSQTLTFRVWGIFINLYVQTTISNLVSLESTSQDL